MCGWRDVRFDETLDLFGIVLCKGQVQFLSNEVCLDIVNCLHCVYVLKMYAGKDPTQSHTAFFSMHQ